MKTIKIFISILFFAVSTQALTVSAQYEKKRISKVATPNNPNAFLTLNLTGYYYRDGASSIFFSKPDYLKDYPDAIFNTESNGISRSFSLFRDTLKNINFAHFDSLIRRYRLDVSAGLCSNVVYNYFPVSGTWEICDSVGVINGLACKYATTKNRNGNMLYEIWIYPEIEMPVGFYIMTNVSGLIVEATYFNTNETFKLAHFDLDTSISKKVFWPEYFNEPFKKK